MRQYERYLFMHLLWPTVVITASLTAIVWLTQILKFMDFMLSRGLSFGDFMYLTGLMLPSLLLMLVPISLCIAVIYTYNRLTVESELIVLNAVGVSKWQLAKPALALGLLCAAFCYALSLYFMPVANAPLGMTRMRVATKWLNEGDGPPLPCEGFAFGETEDYMVNLVASNCTGLSVSISVTPAACGHNNGIINISPSGGQCRILFCGTTVKPSLPAPI